MNKNIFIAIVGVILLGGVFILYQRSENKIPLPEKSIPVTGTVVSDISSERYKSYSEAEFATVKDQKRVIFFYAPWCPTCRPTDQAFTERSSEIPEGVIVFKTDYDTSTELKKKYGITYQHTFVQVDENGNEVAKWNGGDLDTLRANVK